MIKRLVITAFLLTISGLWQRTVSAEPARLAFDTYSGYFVSNKFEPSAAESFVVFHDQKAFKVVKKLAMSAPLTLALDDAKVGGLPEGWVAAKTGEGAGSVWKIVEDPTAPHGNKVLAQISDQGPNRIFNLCIAEKTSFADVDLSVAFKAVGGKLDQGGGLVWHYKDANNYYIARMNPLEDNYRVYKEVAGKRIQLGTADIKIPSRTWHTLRVVHNADHIQCFLDGKLYLDARDDTFPDAGKVGLWTKADAQTYFADFQAK